MSKTLGTVFELDEIFEKATDLIFRGTPADRVVALLADDGDVAGTSDHSLYQIGARTRDESIKKLTEKLTVSRTITQKVMRDQRGDPFPGRKNGRAVPGSRVDRLTGRALDHLRAARNPIERPRRHLRRPARPVCRLFSDHLELISAVAAQTAVTVETVKAHERLAREEVARANYSRFMPEYVVKQLLENPNSFRLGGANQTITVLFADIRGFTAFSENENPEKVVGLLNQYFSAMTEIIFEHGGTLDKYIGDGLMALFGAPTATPHDAKNAVRAAVAMQKRMMTLNEELVDLRLLG